MKEVIDQTKQELEFKYRTLVETTTDLLESIKKAPPHWVMPMAIAWDVAQVHTALKSLKEYS